MLQFWWQWSPLIREGLILHKFMLTDTQILTHNEIVTLTGYRSLEKFVMLPSESNKLTETTLLARPYVKFAVLLLKCTSTLELKDVKTEMTTYPVEVWYHCLIIPGTIFVSLFEKNVLNTIILQAIIIHSLSYQVENDTFTKLIVHCDLPVLSTRGRCVRRGQPE